MRVIAGRLGGRRLKAPRGQRTRPTSERVREALFSLLGPVEGLVALDLFAGSGALAIEALSRGAGRAVLVERDPGALAVLRANLEALELGREVAEIRRMEARAALRSARAAGETYDLVFLDPPYRSPPALGRALSEVLPAVLSGAGRVICESDRRAPLELALPRADERRYGDTLITIHTTTP
ncbi:MAG TPA: 16S rRNA (guanine(966)-N(2))-methyltransferase RsmD [Solirubrobacteraceae bacterium]|nr:16S rRNA (guanine(966)-N(2))-methyltransferase RsmD [Solirubrobacteraceae bacterium]